MLAVLALSAGGSEEFGTAVATAAAPSATASEHSSFQLRAGASKLGARVLTRGDRGRDVRVLQGILRAKRFGPKRLNSRFDSYTARSVRRFQRAMGIEVDGVVGPGTARALKSRMTASTATWYGPGLYGNTTACGHTLKRGTVGVAHRSLPCGTMVTVAYAGRYVRAKVIDRGPYTKGVRWDLTQRLAEKLNMRATKRVRTVHLRPGGTTTGR
ncbi:MAG: peptidoglycan-binding protein [Solirubrobacterales bacterium]